MNDAPFARSRHDPWRMRGHFAKRGGRLVRLAFPETRLQRFGDVVVLYGRYEAVIQSGGEQSARCEAASPRCSSGATASGGTPAGIST